MAKSNQAVEENTEVAEVAEAEAPVAKTPAKKVDIIRGRMPVAMVYAVRFGGLAETGTEKQQLFATTIGKIYDIEKNRNFGYVTEATRFTQEQIDDAIDWIGHHPEFNECGAEKVEKYLKGLTVATEAEAAEFEEVRKASRGQNTKTKDGESADAGGGNRRKGKRREADDVPNEVPAEETADLDQADADDLLG